MYAIDDDALTFTGKAGIDTTGLFRHTQAYHYIAHELKKTLPGQKVLSAGSNIGLEPFSMSSVFHFHGLFESINPVIHATDISERKLRAAKTGIFPKALYYDV